MKIRHRLTATILLIAFASTSALPAAGIPNIKAPPKAVSPPSVPATIAPRIPVVPKVVVPVVPKVPDVKVPTVKIPAAPRVVSAPKIPVVKAAPKIPVTPRMASAPKTPMVKTPVVKKPATPKIPATALPSMPRIVKAPAAPKAAPAAPIRPVKSPVAAKPAVLSGKPSPISAKTSDKSSKLGSSLAPITSTPPPDTTVTILGGSRSNNSSNDSSAAEKVVADQLAALGFSDAEAAKIIAQLKDPATRAAAEKAMKRKADAEATRQLISGFVGEEKAAEIGKKLADPTTRQKTEKNLKLVLEASANLQLAGVDADKANRITDSFIRNGETDPKVINEIVGRVIIKELTGKDVPQSDADGDATALDLVKAVLETKANLQLVGATEDDKAAQDAITEIIKNRVTDPKQVRKIVEAAATTVLEEQGILPPAKPGETLQDRLARAAEEQKQPSKPQEPKKPVKNPGKHPVSLADSFKGRLASLVGAEEAKGPRNNTGSSPSVLEIVFGSKKPRTDGPQGVKDGQFTTGRVRGGNVKGAGAGNGAVKGKPGEVGDAVGRIVGNPGQVSQPAGTSDSRVAKDPDLSPVKDVNRSPNQPANGTPVDNNNAPAPEGNATATDTAATGNAQVSGEQNLPNTQPQQGAATNPAGSNMDTSTGTYTVTDAPTTNADGNTTVGFTVTGSPGGAEDGQYVTTYFSDGTYITERVTPDGGHELVGSGNGTPPNVQEGDTTNVVQGDQAVFAGDDSGDTTNSSSTNGETKNGSDGDDDGSNDNDNDNGDADTPPATTESEDAPADTAEANADTAEASKEGTPNPDAAERGSRGGRMAEATQGRVGGDEQRRQNKGLDQRKNSNGAGGPNPDDNRTSGVLLTAQEQKAFANNLGMKRGGGVTTPADNNHSVVITQRDIKDIAARRGSTINPATTGDGKGGSGQTLGKKGFAPGGAAPAPAPKGAQSSDDLGGGTGVEGSTPRTGAGSGGATGAVFGGVAGPGAAPVRAGAAAASSVRGANVRVNAAQVNSVQR